MTSLTLCAYSGENLVQVEGYRRGSWPKWLTLDIVLATLVTSLSEQDSRTRTDIETRQCIGSTLFLRLNLEYSVLIRGRA